jgi:hypothetical protein
MDIYKAIDLVKAITPKSEESAEAFLQKLPENVQEQLIAAVYIGRDHIHADELLPDNDISVGATDHIGHNQYAHILADKHENLKLYLDKLLACAKASDFDLKNL